MLLGFFDADGSYLMQPKTHHNNFWPRPCVYLAQSSPNGAILDRIATLLALLGITAMKEVSSPACATRQTGWRLVMLGRHAAAFVRLQEPGGAFYSDEINKREEAEILRDKAGVLFTPAVRARLDYLHSKP